VWATAFALITVGFAPLSRSILIILIVAAISSWISGSEHPASNAAYGAEWVRTADGWESRDVLEPYQTPSPPAVHPLVIAAFQLLASLFFLTAFPARVSAVRRSRAEPVLRTHLRPSSRVAAAG
jgi:hypothetical protein